MNRSFVIAALLLCVVAVSGCHTVAGAVAGAQEDYKTVKKADAWLQKNLW